MTDQDNGVEEHIRQTVCKEKGHKAPPAPWSVSAQIVGFVAYCQRCGTVLTAHPTHDFLNREQPGVDGQQGE